MSNKFKYPIDPSKVYTLNYEDISAEVTGEDILSAFRRGVYLDRILAEVNDYGWETNNDGRES
jgi:hypothetical protein